MFPADWGDLSVGDRTVTRPGSDGSVAVDLRGANPTPDLRTADLGGCIGTPCDLVCQNCGVGRKCTLDNSNTLVCVATGGVLPGHACTVRNGDDCITGALCLTAGSSGISACFRYCRNAADCPGGGTCSIAVQGTTARVCTDPVSACAILPASGCSAGTSCYPVNDAGLTGCHVAGSGGRGATCLDSYDCQAGYACFTTPAGCQKLCRRGTPSDCENGQACTNVTGWNTAYGVCL